jgi:peptidyl-prolyl cis-trans isomerase A (cyclophilin A)/peptidyl-prolyl cis-trans isomerase B (cyclophilin B)
MKKLLPIALLLLAACGRDADERPAAPSPASEAAPSETAIEAPSEETVAPSEPTPPPTLADGFAWPATTTRAKIVTSMGDILVELYPDKAPKSVENFLQYARDGHYDRLIFHRVVAGFVIQGGGYSKGYIERQTRAPIPYEGDNGLPNHRTTLAMARTPDPNSATSQFYVNLADNGDQLDHFVNDLGPRYGYAVFGRVIEGMDVVDAIGAAPTGPAGPFEAEVPVEPVVIIRVDPLDSGGAP